MHLGHSPPLASSLQLELLGTSSCITHIRETSVQNSLGELPGYLTTQRQTHCLLPLYLLASLQPSEGPQAELGALYFSRGYASDFQDAGYFL